ncbi:hypothetical protein A2690_01760 [Candidatus Roizmanbacteria bacterium RIFCSPHIGHO2_01_FULL_39_12b]|uniref:Right handed beta helix domain-containing protein n=1 Tax=Candidatus Roizmanbacteria bacterium RIFCSPHIGHO2_01_FULL_39_12b TaxID=1802030 RepID=A0A1F7GBA3_9BACT|nr:MAG: hypothetical protein A2690_01760 [Candidatus Roizmanbacteria bacterium RIFCSPHIGHO2_01_FULL_39_12b]OGK46147.1 MAG: hypothetical protein A3B46_03005 [Candidatus Roizmanbacteria bacterium RIFCSPLOWO2_01_FULL_39_19]
MSFKKTVRNQLIKPIIFTILISVGLLLFLIQLIINPLGQPQTKNIKAESWFEDSVKNQESLLVPTITIDFYSSKEQIIRYKKLYEQSISQPKISPVLTFDLKTAPSQADVYSQISPIYPPVLPKPLFVKTEKYVCPDGIKGENGCDFIGGDGLQEAIDSAPKSSLEKITKIYLRPGHYRRSRPTAVSGFDQAGQPKDIWAQWTVEDKFLIIEGEDNVVLDNYEGNVAAGLFIKDGYVWVNKVRFDNTAETMLLAAGTARVNITFNTFRQGKIAILIEEQVIGNIRDNQMIGGFERGIHISGNGQVKIAHNTISQAKIVGISTDAFAKTRIDNNWFENNTYGIDISKQSRTTITNNSLLRQKITALHLYDQVEALVVNNDFFQTTSGSPNDKWSRANLVSIDNLNSAENNQIVVKNNLIHDSNGFGIYVNNVSGVPVSILSNRFDQNKGYFGALVLDKAKSITIAGNSIYFNDGRGVSTFNASTGWIYNNLVVNNSHIGIQAEHYSEFDIYNNTLVGNGNNNLHLTCSLNDWTNTFIKNNIAANERLMSNPHDDPRLCGKGANYFLGGKVAINNVREFKSNWSWLSKPWELACQPEISNNCTNADFHGLDHHPWWYDTQYKNMAADPMFIDYNNADLRLKMNSPAKSAGTTGEEIGAYGGPNRCLLDPGLPGCWHPPTRVTQTILSPDGKTNYGRTCNLVKQYGKQSWLPFAGQTECSGWSSVASKLNLGSYQGNSQTGYASFVYQKGDIQWLDQSVIVDTVKTAHRLCPINEATGQLDRNNCKPWEYYNLPKIEGIRNRISDMDSYVEYKNNQRILSQTLLDENGSFVYSRTCSFTDSRPNIWDGEPATKNCNDWQTYPLGGFISNDPVQKYQGIASLVKFIDNQNYYYYQYFLSNNGQNIWARECPGDKYKGIVWSNCENWGQDTIAELKLPMNMALTVDINTLFSYCPINKIWDGERCN